LIPDAPSFTSIAQAIGNPRLETALRELSDFIETETHNAGFFPKRSEVRKEISQLHKKTREFEIALNRVSKSLLDLPSNAGECLLTARQAIQAISLLCNDTLSSIPAKGGVSRKPGRLICAMIVIEAWAFAKGKTPGTNETVCKICNDYWRACGGAPIGREGDPANWRRSTRGALLDQSAMRRYIQNEIKRLAIE
jgi:hypothetical protein